MKTIENTPQTDANQIFLGLNPNEGDYFASEKIARELERELSLLQKKHDNLVSVVQSFFEKYEVNNRITNEDIDDLWNAI